MKFKDALKIVTKELKKDKELFYVYQSNMAMSFYDSYRNRKKKYVNYKDLHDIANEAAINFLNFLIKE